METHGILAFAMKSKENQWLEGISWPGGCRKVCWCLRSFSRTSLNASEAREQAGCCSRNSQWSPNDEFRWPETRRNSLKFTDTETHRNSPKITRNSQKLAETGRNWQKLPETGQRPESRLDWFEMMFMDCTGLQKNND